MQHWACCWEVASVLSEHELLVSRQVVSSEWLRELCMLVSEGTAATFTVYEPSPKALRPSLLMKTGERSG